MNSKQFAVMISSLTECDGSMGSLTYVVSGVSKEGGVRFQTSRQDNWEHSVPSQASPDDALKLLSKCSRVEISERDTFSVPSQTENIIYTHEKGVWMKKGYREGAWILSEETYWALK